MPTIFSGVENRISEARERHQELHHTTRQAWQTGAPKPPASLAPSTPSTKPTKHSTPK